ncbi:IS5 family transposase [Acuticoccus sp. I52.16.1]|uniref:IS5 family transposase n=1 Tax=Acuticoccus sp. I52.16.1 TaxID=2928472 RepID=UPI001FD005C1|nr:IS5 family transposase [Acuticoccus sp. I52.16.1]UOM37111.1 IS5 family transposase [Acuticoccus sp. I52.16.1]
MADLFWLSDVQVERIEPHLPLGRCGARRVDDRRVLSGIVHMLPRARWRDTPAPYGPADHGLHPFPPLEPAGRLAGDLRRLGLASSRGRDGGDRRDPRAGAPLRRRRKRGQAIGRSRGGRTSKLHALTDATGRSRVLLLTAGNVEDITLAARLVDLAGPVERLIADRGYDANHLRHRLADSGAEAVIPSTTSRRSPLPYDRATYRLRNVVERMWCRLKDFRRIATRYDRLAANFLGGDR